MNKKKIIGLIVACLMVAFTLSATAADICTVTATWQPPGYYATDGMCNAQTQAVDPAEVIEYTVHWRIKGATEWNTMEVNQPIVTISALPFDTTIEVQVGAHYPGEPVECFSAISEIKTAAKPAPGSCSTLQLTTGFQQ